MSSFNDLINDYKKYQTYRDLRFNWKYHDLNFCLKLPYPLFIQQHVHEDENGGFVLSNEARQEIKNKLILLKSIKFKNQFIFKGKFIFNLFHSYVNTLNKTSKLSYIFWTKALIAIAIEFKISKDQNLDTFYDQLIKYWNKNVFIDTKNSPFTKRRKHLYAKRNSKISVLDKMQLVDTFIQLYQNEITNVSKDDLGSFIYQFFDTGWSEATLRNKMKESEK